MVPKATDSLYMGQRSCQWIVYMASTPTWLLPSGIRRLWRGLEQVQHCDWSHTEGKCVGPR